MPRKRSRLFQRDDSPFWFACWTDHEGRAHRQSTGCRDRRAAETWLATRELERERIGAGLPSARPIALADATGEYLAEREPEWAAKWWGTVKGLLQNQVVPHFGADRTVASIAREEVARFRGGQIGRPKRDGTPVTGATVNRTMWALAAFGVWCVERGYHVSNPWSGHDNLPEDQLPPPSVDPHALEQLVQAVATGHGVRFPWGQLFLVAAETGLRKGELGRLRWEDLDRLERRAWVVSSNARGRNKANKLRPVALSRAAAGVLFAPLVRRPDGFVFGPVPDPRRAFERAAKATGLERVWLHLMRHTAATNVGRAGASLADLMGFGGWSSVRMAQRYTHTDHRRQLEIVDRAGVDPGPARSPLASDEETGGPG